MAENETAPTPRGDIDPSPNHERDDAQDATSLPPDDAFHLLQNSRRRAVLRYLLSNPDREQFVMRDVAEAVAAWEHETTVERITSSQRQRVYISLYQSHLPKLDKHGVVDYDQSRGSIRLAPRAEVLEPLLDVDAGLDAPETIMVDQVDGGRGRTGSSPTMSLLSKFGLQ